MTISLISLLINYAILKRPLKAALVGFAIFLATRNFKRLWNAISKLLPLIDSKNCTRASAALDEGSTYLECRARRRQGNNRLLSPAILMEMF